MSGGNIRVPCINNSEYQTTLKGTDIYLGLMLLEGLETRIAHGIVEEKKTNGVYTSLENFIRRIPIGIETIQILIFYRRLPVYWKT